MGTFAWRRQPTRHFGEQWVPYAELSLSATGDRWRTFSLQVDTGAAISVLRRSSADVLGLDYSGGTPIELSAVGGQALRYFVHKLSARIANLGPFELRVAIAEREDVPNLLGRLDVLDRLQIDLDVSLEETRFSAPWLDRGGRRILTELRNCEATIIAKWTTSPLPGRSDEAVRRLLNRADMLAASATGLMKLHRAQELPLLVRSLFEVSVQFEYIMLDPERRAALYLDYEHITKYLTGQAWTSLPGLVGDELRKSPLRSIADSVNEAEYRRVLPKYALPKRPDTPRSHWYDGNLRQLAAQISPVRVAEYKAIYALHSAWAHGDAWAADNLTPVGGDLWHPFAYWARLLKGIADAKKIILSSNAYEVLDELAKGLTRP